MLKELQQVVCAERFQIRAEERKERLGSLSSLMAGGPIDARRIEPVARQRERARLLKETAPTTLPEGVGEGRRIFEAVVGRDDRLPRQFLTDGDRTGEAVCRIRTVTENGAVSMGTGFAVAPGLILTNNHVLPTARAAARSQVDFGFRSETFQDPRPRVSLMLDPGRLFLTDLHLDFTLTALEAGAGEVMADVFGSIALLPTSGKALVGEAVNVIQHGGGAAQSISLRDNLVVDVFDDWIHYTSDTDPGASGAPVLNDQWQLAALHHAAFAYRTADGREIVVNEGARISSIVRALGEMLR